MVRRYWLTPRPQLAVERPAIPLLSPLQLFSLSSLFPATRYPLPATRCPLAARCSLLVSCSLLATALCAALAALAALAARSSQPAARSPQPSQLSSLSLPAALTAISRCPLICTAQQNAAKCSEMQHTSDDESAHPVIQQCDSTASQRETSTSENLQQQQQKKKNRNRSVCNIRGGADRATATRGDARR